jgi:hypothetical protein
VGASSLSSSSTGEVVDAAAAAACGTPTSLARRLTERIGPVVDERRVGGASGFVLWTMKR